VRIFNGHGGFDEYVPTEYERVDHPRPSRISAQELEKRSRYTDPRAFRWDGEQQSAWKRKGREAMEAALTAPDADEVITDGSWEGFARGRALAWSWNLHQFEPYGAVHPGSEARHRRQE